MNPRKIYKQITILLILTVLAFNTSANTVFRSVKHQKDTIKTECFFEDSKNIQYPIIINKSSGRCYIWKKSSKTGKTYKQYMSENISREVAEQYKITYKTK